MPETGTGATEELVYRIKIIAGEAREEIERIKQGLQEANDARKHLDKSTLKIRFDGADEFQSFGQQLREIRKGLEAIEQKKAVVDLNGFKMSKQALQSLEKTIEDTLQKLHDERWNVKLGNYDKLHQQALKENEDVDRLVRKYNELTAARQRAKIMPESAWTRNYNNEQDIINKLGKYNITRAPNYTGTYEEYAAPLRMAQERLKIEKQYSEEIAKQNKQLHSGTELKEADRTESLRALQTLRNLYTNLGGDVSKLSYSPFESLKSLEGINARIIQQQSQMWNPAGMKSYQAEIKNLSAQLEKLNAIQNRAPSASNERLINQTKSQLAAITAEYEEYKKRDPARLAQEQAKYARQYTNEIMRQNLMLARGNKLNEDAVRLSKQKASIARENYLNVGGDRANLQSMPFETIDVGSYNGKSVEVNALSWIRGTQAINSYSSAINALRAEQERLYASYMKNPNEKTLSTFVSTQQQLRRLTSQYEEYQRTIDKTGTYLDQFMIKARSHLAWIASGAIIAGLSGGFYKLIDQIQAVDSAMASIKQVMPAIEGLESSSIFGSIAEQKARATEESKFLLGIAAQYGETVNKVMDAARSIGRMYGQGENGIANTNIMVSQAAKMATADAFDMIDATRGLESAMAQWNLQTDNTQELLANTSRILDVWTKTAHRGAASAQDIGQAIEVAGTAAAQSGVSFEFFNALVATGVRQTARSGNEIGQAIKSMMVSMQTDKAIKAMQDFGIEVYKVGADGKKSMRSMQDIILDVSLALQTTEKDTNKFLMTLSGGKYQFSKVSAMLKNYKELLHMFTEASNSEGFTDKQVGVQLDTLARKMETIKASLAETARGIGEAGLLDFMISLADHIDNIIVGFNKWGGAIASVTGTAFKLLAIRNGVLFFSRWIESTRAAFSILSGTIDSTISKEATLAAVHKLVAAGAISEAQAERIRVGAITAATAATGAQTGGIAANTAATNADAAAIRNQSISLAESTNQTGANTAATINNTQARVLNAEAAQMQQRSVTNVAVAMGGGAVKAAGFGAAVAALGGPMGVAITAITTVLPLLLMYADYTGEAEKKTRGLTDKLNEETAELQQGADALARRTEDIKTLAEKYNNLRDSLDEAAEGSEKYNRISEIMETTLDAVKGMLKGDEEALEDVAIQQDETGRIIIASLSNEMAKRQAKHIQEMRAHQEKIEADMRATSIALEKSNARIAQMQAEGANVDMLRSKFQALAQAIAQNNFLARLFGSADSLVNEVESLELTSGTDDSANDEISFMNDYESGGSTKGENPLFDEEIANRNKLEETLRQQQEAAKSAADALANALKTFSGDINNNRSAGIIDEGTAGGGGGVGGGSGGGSRSGSGGSGGSLREPSARDIAKEKAEAETQAIIEGLEEGFAQWDGKTMDNARKGCVEAVTKIGSHYSKFLKDELAKGTINTDVLRQNAQEAGIEEVSAYGNTPRPGDVLVFNNGEHVAISRGGDDFVGNASNALGPDGPGMVTTGTISGQGQELTSIIRTGAPTAAEVQKRESGKKKNIYSWRRNEFEENKYTNERAMETYESRKKVIERSRKLYGDTIGSIVAEMDNEEFKLETYKTAQKNAEELYDKYEAGIKDYIDKHKEIGDVLKMQGVEWDKLAPSEKQNIAQLVDNEPFKRMVNQEEQLRKSIVDTTEKIREQTAAIAELGGHMSADEVTKFQMDKNDRKYAIDSISNPWADTYSIKREYLQNQKALLEGQLERQRERLAAAHESAPRELSKMQEKIDAQKEYVESLRAQAEINPEIQSQLTEQEEVLRLLEETREQAALYGTEAERKEQQSIDETIRKIREKEKELREVEFQFRDVLVNGITQMFSDMALEGKKFSTVWKNLWKDIGKFAWKILMQIAMSKAFGSLFGLAGGGKTDIPANAAGADFMAEGGRIPRLSKGRCIPRYNTGHYIKGAGTGTSDSILAYLANKDKFVYLSNGEYVMTAEATKRIGVGNLDRLNKGYADGGALTPTPYVPTINPKTADRAARLSGRSLTERLLAEQNKQMSEQNELIQSMGEDGGNGKMIILNTQASSENVLRALQENPRALNAILGRQNRMGFR